MWIVAGATSVITLPGQSPDALTSAIVSSGTRFCASPVQKTLNESSPHCRFPDGSVWSDRGSERRIREYPVTIFIGIKDDLDGFGLVAMIAGGGVLHVATCIADPR